MNIKPNKDISGILLFRRLTARGTQIHDQDFFFSQKFLSNGFLLQATN